MEESCDETRRPGRPALTYDYLYRFHTAQLRVERDRRRAEEEEAISDDSSTFSEDSLEIARASRSFQNGDSAWTRAAQYEVRN